MITVELKHADIIRAIARFALDQTTLDSVTASVVIYMNAGQQVTATVKLTPKS